MGAAEEPKPIATLTVSLFADGRVQTTGPIDQKMLAYGLLEVARDQIQKFADDQPRSIIRPAVG